MKNAVLLDIIKATAPKDITERVGHIMSDETLAASHRRDARTIEEGAKRNARRLLEDLGVNPAAHNGECHAVPCPHCGMNINAVPAVALEVAPRGWKEV